MIQQNNNISENKFNFTEFYLENKRLNYEYIMMLFETGYLYLYIYVFSLRALPNYVQTVRAANHDIHDTHTIRDI